MFLSLSCLVWLKPCQNIFVSGLVTWVSGQLQWFWFKRCIDDIKPFVHDKFFFHFEPHVEWNYAVSL